MERGHRGEQELEPEGFAEALVREKLQLLKERRKVAQVPAMKPFGCRIRRCMSMVLGLLQ